MEQNADFRNNYSRTIWPSVRLDGFLYTGGLAARRTALVSRNQPMAFIKSLIALPELAISSGYAPKLFQVRKQVLYQMSCPVTDRIILGRLLPVPLGRNRCHYSGLPQPSPYAVAVVSLISNDFPGCQLFQAAIAGIHTTPLEEVQELILMVLDATGQSNLAIDAAEAVADEYPELAKELARPALEKENPVTLPQAREMVEKTQQAGIPTPVTRRICNAMGYQPQDLGITPLQVPWQQAMEILEATLDIREDNKTIRAIAAALKHRQERSQLQGVGPEQHAGRPRRRRVKRTPTSHNAPTEAISQKEQPPMTECFACHQEIPDLKGQDILEIIGTNRMDSGSVLQCLRIYPKNPIQPETAATSTSDAYLNIQTSWRSSTGTSGSNGEWNKLEREQKEHRTLMEKIISAIRHIDPDVYYEYLEQTQPQPAR